MNILMIAPEPVIEPRGTPISVEQRLRALSALNHNIDLATYHIGADVDLPGVNMHRIPSLPYVNRVDVGPSWVKLVLDVVLCIKVAMLLLRRRYDVIHTHEEAAFFGLILAKVFRIPHLYDMHSVLSEQLSSYNFCNYAPMVAVFRALERWAIRASDAIIVVSPELARHVTDIKPHASVAVIENLPVQNDVTVDGYAVNQLRRELRVENKVMVLYTGTFEPYQGLELLVESAKIVCAQQPDVDFFLIGGRAHQIESLRDKIASANLQEHVHLLGRVAISEIAKYLALADILVSPRTDGPTVPLKIYSYLDAAKPIVATTIESHLQVLNDQIALLAAPEPKAFAECILAFATSPELADSYSRRANEFAKRTFSFEAYSLNLDNVYRKLGHPSSAAHRSISAQSKSEIERSIPN